MITIPYNYPIKSPNRRCRCKMGCPEIVELGLRHCMLALFVLGDSLRDASDPRTPHPV